MSASQLMLVTGGTGFLGRKVVKRMLACNYRLRLVTRGSDDWQNSAVFNLRHDGVDVVIGDLSDTRFLEKCLEGVSAIVNLAGIMKESKNDSFETLHVDVVRELLEIGSRNELQRFIHLSCLAAGAEADCDYLKSKYNGELLVRDSSLYWTILRPAYMFGEIFPLLAYLRPFLTFKMFLPLIGSGTNTIQPVAAEDVADCVVQSIYSKATVKKTIDLVGPDKFTMLELLELFRAQLGLGGTTVNIPSKFSGSSFDFISRLLPRSILNSEYASLMSEDCNGSAEKMLEIFDVKYLSLEDYFDEIVDSLK